MLMKNIFLTIACMLCIVAESQIIQQKSPCVSAEIMRDLTENFPEVKLRLNEFEKTIHNNRNNKTALLPIPNSITIPVVVYIVHDGTSLTNISDNQVNDQITALNTYFYTTGIKFCVATKLNSSAIPTVNATDVQSTPGIIHINDPTLSVHSSSSPQTIVSTADPQITKDRYLRIWVVKSIDGANSGILGYSMFPNTSPIFDGIVMRYDVFGNGNSNMYPNYNLGKVLVHEVGHYLGLYHTFEGACSMPNSDCSLDGDHVCDTPNVATPNFNCVSGTDSCPETPAVADDISNYMDYGNNLCQSHFTDGQTERMTTILTISRNTLISSDNILYTGTCGYTSLNSATINCSDFSPCTSTTLGINFSALNAQSYIWNFGDSFSTASNPNTSALQNPTHIYTSSANSPYTVTLTVIGSNGQIATASELIYVTDCVASTGANSYWFLNNSYGLNFSTGRPIFDPSFPLFNYADTLSCNSQCDANGNLLFYTNKFKVWNNQHNQINSIDLMTATGFNTSNQVLIVPEPPFTGNSISKYFIFTQQGPGYPASDKGFRRSTVNVSGTNVSMGQIAQPITLPSSYGFNTNTDGSLLGAYCSTAVQKCNSNDYWIITVLFKGSNLYLVVFSLTNSGLFYNSEIIISGTSGAILKMSSNGNKIIYATTFNGYIYDFNKTDGIIGTNYTTIVIPDTAIPGSKQITDAVFSPDSNLLYLSSLLGKKIYQFNINSINIQNSRKEIASTLEYDWHMTIGPDKKIYVGTTIDNNFNRKLSVIHFPDRIATTEFPNASGFSNKGPKTNLSTGKVGAALPNIIYAKSNTAYFNPNTPNVISKYITACNTYKFFPNVCGTSFIWTFTNTTTGSSVNSTITNPTYNFSSNGTYIVTVKDNLNNLLGTSTPIIITSATSSVIDGSTTACLTRINEKVTYNSTSLLNGETVTWSITGGTGIISGQNNLATVNISWTVLPGTITLTKINAAGCTSVIAKTITSFCTPLNTEDFIDNGLTISPNPSRGIFTINTTNSMGKVTMTVYDLRGRVVLSQQNFDFNDTEKTIDLSGFQSGMYVLKIIGSDFSYSRKLIKN